MISSKLNPPLQLALRYERLFGEEFKSVFIVDSTTNLWELVLQYEGELLELIETYQIVAYDLEAGFAHIFINKNEIGPFSNDPNVIYLSLPKRLAYIDIGLSQICASNVSTPIGPFYVTGENVLLAIVDTGINYRHPDFINPDGTTRIKYLWDQSIKSENPGGTIYTSEQINEALRQSTLEESLEIVPSVDTNGHGTALAGIAAGNGRGSINENNRGVAPNCELLVVKLGSNGTPYPRDVEIMHGINFVISKAKELNQPLAILLGVGSNLYAHDGTAPLELYISKRYHNWLMNVVVGSGNEGSRGSHASGEIEDGKEEVIQLLVEEDMPEYACSLWKPFADEINIVIQAPNGEKTDILNSLTPNRAYLFNQTAVMINISEPIVNISTQEIYILFQGQGGEAISKGVWKISLKGVKVLDKKYNIWGAIVPEHSELTRFLNADLNQTLTIPGTASKITCVGAYNGLTQQIAPFSGRGYTQDGRIHPDITAPGVNVTVPSKSEDVLYTTITGTSAASAFVAGAYVLMLSYGIYQLNNINLYGEVLKIYLLRTARRPSVNAPYPNVSWGYGLLCIDAALNYMKEVTNNSN